MPQGRDGNCRILQNLKNLIFNELYKEYYHMYESFQRIFFLHFEWFMLAAGLLLMALIDPEAEGISLCIYNFLGIEFCPGEGFGRSVALFFRGQFIESFHMHPLGIPGIFIILHRIFSVINRNRTLTNLL